jgi:hypothetical protein
MQLRDNEGGNANTYRRTNIIPFILLLLAVASVASLVYLKSQGVDLKNISIRNIADLGRIFSGSSSQTMLYSSSEIKYSNKEHVAFTAFTDFLVTCTRDNIRFLDKTGDEQRTIPVSMNSPVFSTTNNWLLAADIGGKEITLFDRNVVKWSGSADGNIINADVGANGDIAVVHEAKGYKAALTVYDQNGRKRFSTQLAERFVLSASISPSGKYVLITFIDASGVYSSTVIKTVDIYGEKFGTEAQKENDIYIAAHYFGDDSYAAVGMKAVECYDRSGNKKWTQDFGEEIISSAVTDNYIAVALKPEAGGSILTGARSKVMVYDQKGRQISEYEAEGEVRTLEAYDNIISVNTGNEVSFINTGGKLLGKYASEIEIN